MIEIFDDILVPFDGSDSAENALESAIELAQELDSEIHLIEVVDMTQFPAGIDWDTVIERAKLEQSEELEGAVERVEKAGVFGGKRVTRGVPFEDIIERADELDADLVVMGRTGRSGLESILGSTPERVMERSNRPVMTVA